MLLGFVTAGAASDRRQSRVARNDIGGAGPGKATPRIASRKLDSAAQPGDARSIARKGREMLFDFTTLSAQDRYKLLVSTVVPRPIAWVVTLDQQGRLNAAPYSFFNVFSGEPPVVCIGIGGRKPGDAKDTGNNIRTTGQFVVNLVSEETATQMNITAIEFDSDVDEIHEARLETIPSTKVAPPRIASSPVALECERFTTLEIANDRALVLGRVLALHVKDDAVMNVERCYIDTPKLNLIGRMHGAGWYTRTTDRFEMPRIPVDEWARRND
jgi:flavin reductase (DIM6/NTAB) family NADH-FMN oxidoreductase RutF